jgi:hypothetical protein
MPQVSCKLSLSSTPGSGLDPRPVVTGRRTDLKEDQPSAHAVSRRTRLNWLTRHRRSIRQRASRLPFTAMRTGHVNDRSATRYRRTHRNRGTRRNRETRWNRGTQRSTRGNRGTRRNRRNRSTHRNRGSRRNRPRQSHRNTSHVGEWTASRTARACCRRCTTGLARRRLGASVATGYQRGGRNVRAQRCSDRAQASSDSNYSDVESIKDRHRRRLHSFALRHSAFKWCSRTACRPEVAARRPRQLSEATVDHAPRRTTPFPNGDVVVTFGMV